jgi:CDP-diacylglycerol--serine O-phosphatidyltransferase
MKRGIYILPAIITLCNLGCGYTSILYSFEGRFVAASYLIIFAMMADALDGAMARLTRTESNFGVQLDSLSDVVSFGVAPAILLFRRFGLDAHPFWIFPLFYTIAGALRLARYNATDVGAGSHDFRGTPIPAPAGIVVGLVLVLEELGANLDKWTVILLVFVLSWLMICNIRYPSFRTILKPETPHPFRTLVIILLVAVLLFTHFVTTWLVLGTLYYLGGPVMGFYRKARGKEESGPDAPPDQEHAADRYEEDRRDLQVEGRLDRLEGDGEDRRE